MSNLREYKLTFTGETPLWLHKYDIEQSDAVKAWRTNPDNKSHSKPGDDRTPAWTWITYLHHDGENIAIPAEMIQKVLILAAARVTLKGQKTYKTVLPACMLIKDMHFKFTNKKKQVPMKPLWDMIAADKKYDYGHHISFAKANGFKLDCRPVNVQGKGNIRCRAEFSNWKVEGSIFILDTTEIKDSIFKEIVNQMTMFGFGENRPNSPKPGTRGRFDVTVK